MNEIADTVITAGKPIKKVSKTIIQPNARIILLGQSHHVAMTAGFQEIRGAAYTQQSDALVLASTAC